MASEMIYQLLALDSDGIVGSSNSASLMYLLRGYSSLWEVPVVHEAECSIVDGATRISVQKISGTVSSVGDKQVGPYLLTLSGPYEGVEPRRKQLAQILKEHDFGLVYVLRDDVSQAIACQLYPLLYRIENLLRGYLIRFMATQVGPEWWERTASAEMAQKAKLRKKNEVVFGKHIENSAYLIDFGELGELLYKQSSGFRSLDDVLAKVAKLEETPEAIRTLKAELQSNYQRFFKESFADKGFKSKWTHFEELRNKIAHNNLFTADDLKLGRQLAEDIDQIISAASRSGDLLQLTVEDREAIREQVVALGDAQPAISKDEFLSELAAQENTFAVKPRGFVGAGRFIGVHLASKGFAPQASQKVLNALVQEGLVEVYSVPNPVDASFPTAALRLPPKAAP